MRLCEILIFTLATVLTLAEEISFQSNSTTNLARVDSLNRFAYLNPATVVPLHIQPAA
jgi:hypothetical protein